MDAFLEMLTQKAQPDLDWTYALVTLVFRFFAVFVVLWMIQVGMQVSAFLIRRSERGDGGGAAGGTAAASAAAPGTGADGPDALTAAAIGLALELESQPEAVRIASDRGTSAWSWAGRTRQLRNPPR